jgi:hypothetical protein
MVIMTLPEATNYCGQHMAKHPIENILHILQGMQVVRPSDLQGAAEFDAIVEQGHIILSGLNRE